MSNLLTLCPSRGRPKILEQMLESFCATKSADTNLIIYLNEDDPVLNEYTALLADKKFNRADIAVIIGEKLYLAPAYNLIFSKFQDYDFYAPINDDHYFITTQWDKKLIKIIDTELKGCGLAAAEDNLTQWAVYQHPSGCVVSGNIPRTLGYFIYPEIQHIGVDCYLMHLMKGINRLYHATDIVIEHRHWLNGKALLDENYKWVYNQAQYNYGMGIVYKYIANNLQSDIAKLQEMMKGNNA